MSTTASPPARRAERKPDKGRKPRTEASFRSAELEPEYLTREQAADYINVSPRWIKRAIDERRIAFHKLGNHVRISRADLDAYMAVNRHEPA